MLTLFVIPGSRTKRENFNKAAQSFGGHVKKVYILSGVPFDNLKFDTEWCGFIYSNEELSEGVRDVLDTYLNAVQFDYYTFYIKMLDETIHAAPRLFRKTVKLRGDAPYPVSVEEHKGTFILDGWILEQE